MKRGPKLNAYGATEEDYATNYAQEYRRCNKPNCHKCSEGPGHGPYWFSYHYSPALGRRIKTYLGKETPPAVSESASTHAADQNPPAE